MPILCDLSVFFKLKMNCTKYKFSEIKIKSTSESDKKADKKADERHQQYTKSNFIQRV